MKVIIQNAITYVLNQDLKNMECGKYNINNDDYYVVQSYVSKNEEICRLESHIKYVDVQLIISGEEKIKVTSINGLTIKDAYNEANDIIFYEPIDLMSEVVLKEGSYVILYPNDAHMPGIKVNGNTMVKKVVIKVKIR